MANAIPLDEQIVAVLTGECRSDQVPPVLRDAEKALKNLAAEADAADVASLSPLATAAQARELRQKAADLRFDADRLDASVAALRSRESDLRDAEENARAETNRAAACKARDELAADIARDYPRIVGELTSLVKRIQENDAWLKAIGDLNGSAEAIGRGIPATFYASGQPFQRLYGVSLPMPSDAGRGAWEDRGGGVIWRGLECLSKPTPEAKG